MLCLSASSLSFRVAAIVAICGLTSFVQAFAQDTIEFANGSVMKGEILEIRKSDREFDFSSTIGGKTFKRTYSYDKVQAVTYNGKRFVLNEAGGSNADDSATGSDGEVTRTKEEVLAFIESVGSTDPDWLASTQLNHPKSLELAWPMKAEGPWNESKNVGQYIWGRVNPNESRWKPGVKLIYECMKLHENDSKLLRRDMEKLGDMYFTLFQDYPRAAYWLQKANVSATGPPGIFLAECYWRLGCKPMAMSQLRGKSLHFSAIKLFGDMGELKRATSLTRTYSKSSVFNEAFLNMGDALRGAGQMDQAVNYYQQIIDRNQARNAEYLARYKGRAQDAIEAIELSEKADVQRVADGSYTASSMGYNGQLEVEVQVASHKITQVRVTNHREKQFYAALSDTPKQILAQQGVQDVDGTSGATITSQAIIASTAKALARGAN
ncbi:FMN-binding domain protein [Rubripirellula amarantea]|uniref:FMN-binding domain protein n=1 Tax=Rubripirellula amarantea TaxID=2527999 RepID=A0A5C5WIS0_9BACT|nr:FMN-binding protein [Rubripirellula amarantea]TWT50467.1 FMN-binding domain protein [Rubripirellula amarantea]